MIPRPTPAAASIRETPPAPASPIFAYGDLARFILAQLAIDRHLIAALRGAITPTHPEFAVVGKHLDSALALVEEIEGR